MPPKTISGVKIKEEDVIEDALADLRKKYGNDVVMQDNGEIQDVEAIPTGCFALDRLLGCGGLPKGRIIETYGEPSSGKSALSLYLISQIQKRGGRCVVIDAEFAWNAEFAQTIGVDIKKLYVSQPATLEEGMDTVRALVKTNQIDLIVVDSVAALVPKKEVEGEEMLKDSVAMQARLMNLALRILTGEVARSKTIVIFINHLKEKIGIVYGSNVTTPGGKALKFYASVRLEIKKGERLLKGDAQIGNEVKVVAVKNKVGFPFRKGSFELYYATGINQEADTLDTAEELKVVKKEGNTYEWNGIKLGVGRDKAVDALKKDAELYKKLHAETSSAVKKENEDRKSTK